MNKINNLTIEDIHNIRHENYEKTRNLSFGELIHETARKAQAFKNGLLKHVHTDVLEAHSAAELGIPYNTKDKKEC
jgi:hypothetical protein